MKFNVGDRVELSYASFAVPTPGTVVLVKEQKGEYIYTVVFDDQQDRTYVYAEFDIRLFDYEDFQERIEDRIGR